MSESLVDGGTGDGSAYAAAVVYLKSDACRQYQALADSAPGTEGPPMSLGVIQTSAAIGLTILDENGSEILTYLEGEL